MIKDKRNIIYVVIIAIVLLITSVATFTFAYINRPNATGNTNVSMNINNITNSLSMSYTGDTNLTLNLTLENLSILNATNDYSNFVSTEGSVTVNFTADLNVYPSGAKCDYVVKYVPTSTFSGSIDATNANLNELTISGTNGTNSFNEVSLASVSSALTLYSSTISTTTGSASHTWDFTMKFYNLNVNQAGVIGQTPAGKITITPGTCAAL